MLMVVIEKAEWDDEGVRCLSRCVQVELERLCAGYVMTGRLEYTLDKAS